MFETEPGKHILSDLRLFYSEYKLLSLPNFQAMTKLLKTLQTILDIDTLNDSQETEYK